MANPIAALLADVRQWPRWAVVAFAARCARRVLPAYFQGEPVQDHVTASVYYAIWAAQEAAAQGQPPGELPPPEPGQGRGKPPQQVEPARLTDWTGTSPSRTALKCAGLAYKIARATKDPAKEMKSLLNLLPRTANKHPSLLPAVRRDLDRLSEAARQQEWSDDTPVPATVFGPLWHEEPPHGWPVAAPVLDPARWRDWLVGKRPAVPRMDTAWVHTAFAARCAHRILPLLHQCPDDALLARHAEALWLAAELAANPASVELQEQVKKVSRQLAANMHSLPFGLPNHINHSLTAARMTVWLAEEALLKKPPLNPRSRALTQVCTQAAADSLGVTLAKLEARDWEHVLRWAVTNAITANTGVPQSVFAPLWDKGPPATWPEPAEVSLDSFRTVATRQTPPPVAEVEVLPRWAVAVFCLRVLQRATPWMAHKYPGVVGPEQFEVIQHYLRTFAEILEAPPPSGAALDRLLAENRASIATTTGNREANSRNDAINFSMAIYELDRALHSTLGAHPPNENKLAQALFGLKRYADSVDGSKGILGFSQLTSDELTHLKRRAAAEGWTHQTPVPPSSCGPLWPNGAPPWWAE